MNKRLPLIAVTLFIVFSFSVPVQAYTAHTRDEALRWMQMKVGESIDADGYYGAQCVDLILSYYDYLGVPRSRGNGADYVNNSLPEGWSRIQGAQPQPGDILVYTGGLGHVGLYESDYVSYHQNFNGSYVERITYKYNGFSNPYWGIIRPDFAANPTLSPSNLGDDFYAFIINSSQWKHLENNNRNVQVALNGNNSTDPRQIWHFIRQADNSYKIVNEYDGTCLDAANMSSDNGTNIATYIDNGLAAQRWNLCLNDNAITICSTYCNKVIDLQGGSTDPATNVWLYDFNNTSAQKFSIYNLTSDGVNYKRKPLKEGEAPVVTGTENTDKGVKISWTSVEPQSKYDNRVYKVSVWDGSDQSIGNLYEKEVTGTETTMSLNKGKYYVKVTAVNTKYLDDTVTGNAYTFTNEIDTVIKGDINGDGIINSEDALAALKNSCGLITLNSIQKETADVNSDNIVNANDALMILKNAAGLLSW